MKYLLLKYDDEYIILNDVADYHAGYVRPFELGRRDLGYRVTNDEGDAIAVVKSIGEAVPALAAYYEKNPPRWKRECPTRYIEWTHFGLLRVEQDRPGRWLAYRDDYPLLRDGKPAVFATPTEAQRVTDAHLRDDYPDSQTMDDGFSWLPNPEIDWRLCPYRTATRAARAVA
jgi:hypothetical protein